MGDAIAHTAPFTRVGLTATDKIKRIVSPELEVCRSFIEVHGGIRLVYISRTGTCLVLIL